MKESELLLIGASFIVRLFEEGIKGEILQFVLTYL